MSELQTEKLSPGEVARVRFSPRVAVGINMAGDDDIELLGGINVDF